MGQPLYCSAADAGVWGESDYDDGSIPYMWLSSIALLPLLPGFPPPAFPSMISSLTCPQSVSPQSTAALTPGLLPKLQLPTIVPSRGPAFLSRVCMAVARTVWVSFHLGCHRPAVSLSTLNVSTLIQTVVLMWGSDPCFSFPTHQGQSSATTLLFFPLLPSSHQVLRGSTFSFPLVRYSCPLLAGVLDALLCLKVYSWCIHGEKCIPCPPTPLPSCSRPPTHLFKFQINSSTHLKCVSTLSVKVKCFTIWPIT